MADKAIEVLLDEKRNFPPPKTFKRPMPRARASLLPPEESAGFLGQSGQGAGVVQALEKGAGVGFSLGQMVYRREAQCLYNCLDRRVKGGRKNKAAIIWEGEPGDERVLTYRDMWREVNKFANVFKKLGVKKATASASTWV